MATLSAADAVAYIQSQTGDNSKWRLLRNGFIDWKFGELAEFMGYTAARAYAESAIRWADGKARGSTLEETYLAFLEATNPLQICDSSSLPSSPC